MQPLFVLASQTVRRGAELLAPTSRGASLSRGANARVDPPMGSGPADERTSRSNGTSIWLTPDAFLQRPGRCASHGTRTETQRSDGGGAHPSRDRSVRPSQRKSTASVRTATDGPSPTAGGPSQVGGSAIVHSLYYDLPLSGQKSIVTVHDMMHERLGIGSSIIRRQKQRSVRRADVVVCDSECTVRDLLDMGIRSSSVQQFLSVSPMRSSKGLRVDRMPAGSRTSCTSAIAVTTRISTSSSRRSRLPGPGRSPSGARRRRAVQRERTRHWTIRRRGGAIEQKMAVTDGQLGALYRSAAALVITSRYEGFGLPLLEAMACGCPVASSGGGSLAEYDGGHAARFDPNDSQSCCDAILGAIQSSASQRISGRDHARGFTWAKTADRYIEAYEQAGWTRS